MALAFFRRAAFSAALLAVLMPLAAAAQPLVPPEGWQVREQSGGYVFTPPDLDSGEQAELVIFPEERLESDFRAWFSERMQRMEKGLKGLVGSAVNQAPFQGGEALNRLVILQGPGGYVYCYYVAARKGARVRMAAYLAGDEQLFEDYLPEVQESLATFEFETTAAARAPPPAPSPSPTRDVTTDDIARVREQLAIQGDMFKALQLKREGKLEEACALYTRCRDRAMKLPLYDNPAAGSADALYNVNIRDIRLSAATSVQTCYVDLGRFEEALKAGREVMAAIDPAKEPLLAARAHHALSDAYKGLLQYEKALREAEKARTAADRFVQEAPARFQAWSGQILDKETARQVQQFYEACSEARQIYMKACLLLDLMGRAEEVIETYTGKPYESLASLLESEDSLKLLHRALEVQFGQEFAAVILEKMKQLNAQNDYQVETAISFAYRTLAQERQQADLYDQAEKRIDNLRDLLKERPDMFGPMHVSIIEGSQAQVDRGRKDYPKARKALLAALKDAAKVEPMFRRELEFNLQLAMVDVSLEDRPADPKLARASLDRAVAITRERAPADSTWRWRLPFAEGRVLAAEGKREAAADALRRAVDVIEQERSGVASGELKDRFFRGRQRVYEEYFRVLHELGREADAMTVMERVRSRSLLEGVLATVKIRKGLSPALARQIEQVEKAEAERLIAENRKAANPDLKVLTRTAAEIEQQKARTFADILKESAELADLKGADPLPPSEIAKLLDDDTVLLEYLIGERYAAVAVLTSAGTPVIVTLVDGDTRPIVDDALRLRSQVTRPRGDDWKQTAASLHRALIAPIQTHLAGKRRVVLIPYGRLHFIPWSVLGEGQMLAESHEVITLPSASVLKFCRDKQRPRKETLTAFALGDQAVEGMDALPGTEAEAQTIVQLFPKGRTVAGKRFTVDSVRQGSKGVDVLHFATHGVFDHRAPEASAIVAVDGRLAMQDIFNLDLSSTLVVLSACNTGRAEVYTGNEMVGLVRAFMYAGTPSVVATLWQVADQSTALMMKHYYEALKQGADKAAALKTAQAKLRETHPHPFFWAPFIVVGDWR